MGLVLTPDLIGGPFLIEEKEFMIDTANLEYRWRMGKKEKGTNLNVNLGEGTANTAKHIVSMLSFGADKVWLLFSCSSQQYLGIRKSGNYAPCLILKKSYLTFAG